MSTGSRLLCVWIVALLAVAALFIPREYVQSKPAAEPAEGAGLFVENVGQFDSTVRFVQMSAQGSARITQTGILLTRSSGNGYLAHNLMVRFEGANEFARIEPFDRKDTHISYLIGSDPSGWHTDVPVWGGIRVVDLYPDIDLVLDGKTFDWRLNAGPAAEVSRVRLAIEGAQAAEITSDSILISSPAGNIELPLPVLSGEVDPIIHESVPAVGEPFEEAGGITILAPYRNTDEGISETGGLDAVEGLKWATYLGGSLSENSRGIAVNSSQQVFITGDTYSTDFPITPGVIDTTTLNRDAYVAKLSPDGSNLLYATYLGGSSLDSGNDIAVEGSLAYVVGDTESSDFPGAGEPALDKDAFAVSLNANGTGLNYSILYGGSDTEYGNGIAVESGNAYITGSTYSNDIQGVAAKKWDGFAAKLNSSGVLQYGVLFGGRFDDGAYDIAASGGSVYIAGDSDSPDMGCSGYLAGDDAYLLKLGSSGEMIFCKSLGGFGTDTATGVAVESSGRGVIVGQTDSIALGEASGNSGGMDAFMAVLNTSGTAWEYVTFLGGTGTDSASTVLVDRSSGIQVAGGTSSADFPVSADAEQGALHGASDGFIARFAPAWTLEYATYLGGTGDDSFRSAAVDLWGYTYLAGETSSEDFPVSAGSYDPTFNGVWDGFAAKMGIGPTPGVVLKKFTNGYDADLPPGPSLQVGTAIQWRYDVYNTGATALSSVAVSDNQGVSVSCPATSLDAGASMSCTANGTAQVGQYSNTGTVSAHPPGDLPIVSSNDSSHYFGAQPAVVVVKSVSGNLVGWFDANSIPGPSILVDLPVYWKYTVNNTGNVSLGNITVTDSDTGLVIYCPVNALAAGGSMDCSSQGIAIVGQYSNLTTVSATPPDGLPGVNDTDSSHYFGVNPGIAVEKSVSVDNGSTWLDADSAPGPTLLSGYQPKFRVTVQNTGNVPLTAISVSDSDFALSSCPTSLAIGASASCVIVTAGWSAGQHENTVTAQGSYTDNFGHTRIASGSDKAYYYGAISGLDVIKEVSVNGGTTWSDANTAPGLYLLSGYLAPRFRFTVINTGNVALDNVTLSDLSLTIPPACASGGLQPNDGSAGGLDERTCTVELVWAAGQHSNTVTASSSFSDSGGHSAALSDTDKAYYYGASPAITVKKEVSINNGAAWQDANSPTGPALLSGFAAPKFRLTVTNTGNVTLNTLALVDTDFSTSGCTIPTELAPTASYVCTITGAWSAGQHANSVIASGKFTDSAANFSVKNASDMAHYFGAAPGLDVSKYVSLNDGSSWEDANSAPGGTLVQTGPAPQYKLVVKNTGNVALTAALSDSRAILPTGCQTKLLSANDGLPGGTDEFECVYTATWAAGAQNNTASASSGYTDGAGNLQNLSDNDAANYYGAFTGLDVSKEVSGDGGATWLDANTAPGPYLLQTGATPQFRFTVKNTGNVDLPAVTFSDNVMSLPAGCASGALAKNDGAPGGTDERSCTVSRTWAVNQQSNIATATANYSDSQGHPMDAADSDSAYYFGANPKITLQKLTNDQDPGVPEDLYILVGEPVTWKYTITNAGNVTLTNIVLTDDNGTPGDSGDDFTINLPGSLGPGQATVKFKYGTTVEGIYANTALVSGLPPVGSIIQTSDASRYFGADPAVSIIKSVSSDGTSWDDADQAPGPLLTLDDPVYWKYEIRNEGNVQLTSVTVSDDQSVSVTCPRTYLNITGPNQTMTCTASGTVLSGQYKNIGTVSGSPPGGLAVVQASEASHYYGKDPTKQAALFYKVNGISTVAPPGLYTLIGAQLSWSYEVKNLLPTELTNLDVVDNFSGSDQVVCHIDSIPSEGSHLCSPRSETAQEGQHSYTATVRESLSGNEISTPADGHYFGVRPGITIEKRISGDGGVTWDDADFPPGPVFSPGTALIWKYVITNTSNVLLTGIDLLDDREGPVPACQDFSLAPGAFRECTLASVSQASAYSNTGSVSGLPPGGLSVFTASDLCHYTGWVKVYLPVILK